MASLFDQPLTRAADPPTSRAAAESLTPGLSALEAAILHMASSWHPQSAFALAQAVEGEQPGRWDEGTIRSRVSKLGKRGLLVTDGTGKSPRGHDCDLWRLP